MTEECGGGFGNSNMINFYGNGFKSSNERKQVQSNKIKSKEKNYLITQEDEISEFLGGSRKQQKTSHPTEGNITLQQLLSQNDIISKNPLSKKG
jgi:hypothetical protein